MEMKNVVERIITAIWCETLDGCIGNTSGKQAIEFTADRLLFREMTKNHVVIMGRKTFESMGSEPLSGRINIVVTSKPGRPTENTLYYATNIKAAIRLANIISPIGSKIFIIGGAQLFESSLKYCTEAVFTRAQISSGEYNYCDNDNKIFRPELDNSIWVCTFNDLQTATPPQIIKAFGVKLSKQELKYQVLKYVNTNPVLLTMVTIEE